MCGFLAYAFTSHSHCDANDDPILLLYYYFFRTLFGHFCHIYLYYLTVSTVIGWAFVVLVVENNEPKNKVESRLFGHKNVHYIILYQYGSHEEWKIFSRMTLFLALPLSLSLSLSRCLRWTCDHNFDTLNIISHFYSVSGFLLVFFFHLAPLGVTSHFIFHRTEFIKINNKSVLFTKCDASTLYLYSVNLMTSTKNGIE